MPTESDNGEGRQAAGPLGQNVSPWENSPSDGDPGTPARPCHCIILVTGFYFPILGFKSQIFQIRTTVLLWAA